MKKVSRILAGAALALGLSNGTTPGQAVPLKVSDDAPGFSLKGSDGKTHKLSDSKGKRAVVIAWFPKAFTGG
jgi:peroxiredoxin Q/BCP